MKPLFSTRAAGAGITAVCVAVASAIPASASAQETMLEEITVTAQKREQSELEVPMTLDVFTGKDITDTGALNLQDIQDFIPGFEVGTNPTQASITIRGVSAPNISTGGDPSVATFYDEVYVPRAATTASFTDLQRVEVLKGPQGTLYGRNAAAGVVSMVPTRPQPEKEAFIKTRFGNYNLFRVEGMANIPLTDKLYTRLNILSNQRDGYITNLAPGERDPGQQDNIAVRASLLWDKSDRTDLQVSLDVDTVDNAPRPAVGLSQWSACPDDPRCDVIFNDVVDGKESRDMWSANVKLNHDMNDNWAVKFIAGYRSFDTINKQDEDGTMEIDRYLDTDNIENSDILYTELQFAFSNDRWNAVFGINYSSETTHQEIPVNTNVDSVMRAVTSEVRGGVVDVVTQQVNAMFGITDPDDPNWIELTEQEALTALQQQLGLPVYPDMQHLWDPLTMALTLNLVAGVPATPTDVALTGDLFYDLVQPAFPGPLVGPSFAGSPWSEYYFNDGKFKNLGIYGDVDYQLTDRWNILVGLRYSADDKTFSWRNPPNTFSAIRPGTPDLVFVPIEGFEEARTGTLVANHDWDNISGRAVARFQVTDSAQMFASYSTGYIAGGYDSLDVETSLVPIRPEESENFELGLKGNFFGDRLRLQLSYFDMTVEGRKRTVDTLPPGQPNPIPRVISGDFEVSGIELVADWYITDSFRAALSTTARDADEVWDPFYNSSGELVTEVNSSSTDTDYTVTLGWMPELSFGALDMRVDYIFNEVTPNPLFPGFYEDREELNARFGWTSEDDKWTAALWGKNLLDQKLLGGIRDISILFGTPFTSRDIGITYGVEVGYRFQ